MSSHQPTQIVQLSAFQPANFVAAAAAGDRPPHPERASTPCGCQSPEPCYQHDPAGLLPPGLPVTAHCRQADPEPPLDVVCYDPEAVAARPVLARMTADTVCQCIAPEPCRTHPDDRPWIKRPAPGVLPDAGGVLGRLDARPEPGGVQLEVEARCRLPRFADEDVAMLVRLVSAEHRRRNGSVA